MLKDVLTVNEEIRRHFPELPLILFGHSMGSLAVRAFAAKHDDCMNMLIVCGSPSENKARPLGKAIAKVQGKLLGSHHKSKILETMSFGTYALKFKDEKNKNAWICSDPAVYEAYTKSDLCGFTFTDDAYIALFDLMKKHMTYIDGPVPDQRCLYYLSVGRKIRALEMYGNLQERSMPCEEPAILT